MADIIIELREKRKIIEQFQRDVANQEGRKEQLLNQLKTECGAETVEQGDKVVEELGKERKENEALLEELGTKMDTIIHDAVPGINPRSG